MSLNLLRSLSPPTSAHRFRSNDLDEVRTFIGRSDGEHSRVAHGAGVLEFEISLLCGEHVNIGWGQASLGQTVRGATRDPVLHVPIDQRSTYRFGRRQEVVGLSSAMFIAPGWEFTRESASGSMLGISVNRHALVREISARRNGADADCDFRMRSLQSDGFAGSDFAPAVVDLALALTLRSAGAQSPCQFAEARVISGLAGVLVRESAVAPAPPLTSKRLAALEDWIEGHLGESITLGQLCEAAGVGDRCLQQTFELRRGMSPMRFVAERRMRAVHRRLRAAGWADDVTSIATWYGFLHLGRFAAAYRQTFGESPSQTLRASARQAPSRSGGTDDTPPIQGASERAAFGFRIARS